MCPFDDFQVPLHKKPKWLWNTIDRWLQTCDTKLACNVPTFAKEVLEKIDLRSETKWLKKRLEAEGSPVVFCHNDMQEGNILVRKDQDKDNNNEEPQIVIIGKLDISC